MKFKPEHTSMIQTFGIPNANVLEEILLEARFQRKKIHFSKIADSNTLYLTKQTLFEFFHLIKLVSVMYIVSNNNSNMYDSNSVDGDSDSLEVNIR